MYIPSMEIDKKLRKKVSPLDFRVSISGQVLLSAGMLGHQSINQFHTAVFFGLVFSLRSSIFRRLSSHEPSIFGKSDVNRFYTIPPVIGKIWNFGWTFLESGGWKKSEFFYHFLISVAILFYVLWYSFKDISNESRNALVQILKVDLCWIVDN